MTADKPATREVHHEAQAPAHGHLDSHQLQQGATQPGRAEQATANSKLEKMGFPSVQAPQAEHGERGRERQVTGTPDRATAKGDQPAQKGDQPPKAPAVMKPSDKPTTGTEKNPDGSSQSLVRDDLHKNYTGISKDKDGNVRQISKIEQGHPAETTTYSKDGKPLSDSVKGNGTRTWDEHGKLLSDDRKDKSNTHRPDALKTTKNSDGTTTVKSGPGDGSSTKTTFDKDGNVTAQEQNSGKGSDLRNEFKEDGTLSRQQYTATDKDGKMVEQNSIDYDKQGRAKRVESSDATGSHSLAENDENGRPVKRELNQPKQNYSRSETWDKEGGYSSVTRDGNDRTTATVKDGVVDFKHEKLQ